MDSMIAIITARGGSKRIPRKNIKSFMGKPMLAYAIEAALGSGLFETVMVSTDDDEIAETAMKYSAEVPFMRSDKTASDYATTYDVLEEVVNEYENLGKHYNKICCIYPCVPFLSSDILINAYSKFTDEVNAVLPVCEYPVPVEWAFVDKNGFIEAADSEAIKIRSQDLMPKYFDVGMFYYVKTKELLSYKSLTPPNTAPFIMDRAICEDIDTMEDWKMAELKYRMLHEMEEKIK